VAALATSERDPTDPVATRSYFEVAAGLIRHWIEVSVSQTWHILTGMDIDLTKVRGWLKRRDDPDFWERVQDICGLYLDPPQRVLVLSVDEKSSIQVERRKQPDQTPRTGRWRRREFEYTVTAPHPYTPRSQSRTVALALRRLEAGENLVGVRQIRTGWVADPHHGDRPVQQTPGQDLGGVFDPSLLPWR